MLCAGDPVHNTLHPGHVLYAMRHRNPNPMHMSNGNPELCDSRLRLGKLGSRGFLRASCGCTLNLGSKGENLVLGTASPGQITTTRSGLPSKPLSYSHTTSLSTASCHTRFIRFSDSSTRCTIVKQLSMSKHNRYRGSSDAHKQT